MEHPKKLAVTVTILVICMLFAACGTDPLETQGPTVPYSESYEKLLAINGADQYDPAVLEAFALWIDGQDGFLESYPDNWKLEKSGNIWLTCYSPRTDGNTRTLCNLVYDGEAVYEVSTYTQQYTDVAQAVIIGRVFSAKNSRDISDELKSAFVDFIMDSEWFPNKAQWSKYQSEWHFDLSAPTGEESLAEYATLHIKYWEAGSIPGDLGTLHTLSYNGTEIMELIEDFILTTEVPEPTIPTEPEPTEPFVKEESPAYQKLLTLPNAEDFLCNEFGYNYLEIFAECIDSQDGFMEAYPEKWNLFRFHDAAAMLTCCTPQQEDGTYRYYEIHIIDANDIRYAGEVGSRYFTDIPREEIAALVYSAPDPIGVDHFIKEMFIDYILYSDWFAWSVLNPEFQVEWYYDRYVGVAEPEDDVYEHIRLHADVWRPGMAPDERFECYLVYVVTDGWKQVSYGSAGNFHEWALTGNVPKGSS